MTVGLVVGGEAFVEVSEDTNIGAVIEDIGVDQIVPLNALITDIRLVGLIFVAFEDISWFTFVPVQLIIVITFLTYRTDLRSHIVVDYFSHDAVGDGDILAHFLPVDLDLGLGSIALETLRTVVLGDSAVREIGILF